MKLYVIRHGKTQCNEEGKYNGRLDEDINETGVQQAKIASKQIEKLDIDRIICSPMLRTRHTCELINVNHVPVIYDERIAERDTGILTNQPLGDFYYTDYWNYYSTKTIEGLETIPDLFRRVKVFLEEIKQTYPDETIVFVTHGGVARAIYFYFHPLPQDGLIGEFGSSNCGITEYEL